MARTPRPLDQPDDRRVGPGRRPPPLARQALRQLWRASGKTWDTVLPRHVPRNLAIARMYIETDTPVGEIAARHGLTRARVPVIARTVVYNTLGLRLPR